MSPTLLALGAQLGAEMRTRLRSAGTLVALGFILAGSTLWMPDPHGKAASLTWRLAGDVVYTPVYRAPYVGVATAILAAVFLMLVAFYLVAGSVRRDRETGVGAILAATPLGKGAYLAGKVASNAAYLGFLSVLILGVGVAKLLALGEGPLEPARFLGPWLFVTVPGTLFIAAMAVLFDVTPGLAGRAGLVVWFFASIFLLVALPMGLAVGLERQKLPVFDPIGLATMDGLIKESLPPEARSVSVGLIFGEGSLERAPWAGIQIPARALPARLATFLLAGIPFFLSTFFFDRFDPARRLSGRGTRQIERKGPALPGVPTENGADGTPPSATFRAMPLAPITAKPGPLAALLTEARLLWTAAPFLRWPLVAASLAGAFLPGEASSFAAAAFLVLLVPVISEAGARESLAGAGTLVFSQPSVPRSTTLWKLGSVALFLGALSAPLLVRALLSSPARLFALATGLLFLAAFAASAALLTGGGRLFSGLALTLLYMAASKLPAADFCGTFGGGLGMPVRAVYLLIGAAFVSLAMLVERWRRRGRR